MSEVIDCRKAQLRDRAKRCRESAGWHGMGRECLNLGADELEKQAASEPCECGHCGDDEG